MEGIIFRKYSYQEDKVTMSESSSFDSNEKKQKCQGFSKEKVIGKCPSCGFSDFVTGRKYSAQNQENDPTNADLLKNLLTVQIELKQTLSALTIKDEELKNFKLVNQTIDKQNTKLKNEIEQLKQKLQNFLENDESDEEPNIENDKDFEKMVKIRLPCNSLYVGSLKANKMHGQGVLTFNNGGAYLGEFKNGKYHGQGQMLDIEGQTIARGVWKKGKLAKIQ